MFSLNAIVLVGGIFIVFTLQQSAMSFPLETDSKNSRTPKQLQITPNNDGGFSGHFANSQAFNTPIGSASMGFAEDFNFGRHGSSFSEGSSMASNFGGNSMAMAQASAFNNQFPSFPGMGMG